VNHGHSLGWTHGAWIRALLVWGSEDSSFVGKEYPKGPKVKTHLGFSFGKTRVNGSEGPGDRTSKEFSWRKVKYSRSHEEQSGSGPMDPEGNVA
jgi:hypothetical protein